MTGAGGEGAEVLADRAWPSLDRRPCWVLVPVGSLEQHGPHLPLRTDTLVAGAVARAAAEDLAAAQPRVAVTVAPAVEYGAAGEHQDFPGTLSIGHAALRLLLLELGRSATTWAERVVLVNGHGGNLVSVAAAVTQLRAEGRAVGWTSCAEPGCDAHAGEAETSLMLALRPWLVGADPSPGEVTPVAELMGTLRAEGVRAVSASGVLGDPSTASEARGQALLTAMGHRVAGETARMDCDERGRLR